MIDLFDQIKRAYLELPSIFDKFTSEDWILAFFPCTEFEDQKTTFYLGNAYQLQGKSDEYKLRYAMYYHDKLVENYDTFCKMVIVCYRKNLKMVIENPNGGLHYLKRYFPIKAKVIDQDRTLHGDMMKKPTQYWFINCEPRNELSGQYYVQRKAVNLKRDINGVDRQRKRSEITPEYAGWFIDEYIGVEK